MNKDIFESEINSIIEIVERTKSHPEYLDLLKNIPNIYGKTVFDLLTDIPDMILIEYEELFQVKKKLKAKYKFFLSIEDSIKDIIYEKKYNQNISVNKIYKDDSIDEKNILDLMSEIESKISIIPSNLREKYFDIIFSRSINYSNMNIDNENYTIVLNHNQDKDLIISDFFHELGHIIEYNNKEIKEISNSFINKRKKTNNVLNLKEFCEKNDLNYRIMNENVNIYDCDFIDPYIGRVYNDNHTEVISTGLQLFFLDPVNFMFKDSAHFVIIYNIIKGNYGTIK